MDKTSDRKKFVVKAWMAADTKGRDEMETIARRILCPVIPTIRYEMEAQGKSSRDVAWWTGIPKEKVELIRDARLESLKKFLRYHGDRIRFLMEEKQPLEGQLLRSAIEMQDWTVVRDLIDMILICAWLCAPVEETVRDFLSREVEDGLGEGKGV